MGFFIFQFSCSVLILYKNSVNSLINIIMFINSFISHRIYIYLFTKHSLYIQNIKIQYNLLELLVLLFAAVCPRLKSSLFVLVSPLTWVGYWGFRDTGRGRCVYLFFILSPLSVSWHICIPHLLSPLWIEIKKKERRFFLFLFSSFFLNRPLALPFSSAALIAMNLVTHVFHQLMSVERVASPGDGRWSECSGQKESHTTTKTENNTHTDDITV